MDNDLYKKYVEWQDKNPPFIIQQYHCKNCGAPLNMWTNHTGTLVGKTCPYCHIPFTDNECFGTIN